MNAKRVTLISRFKRLHLLVRVLLVGIACVVLLPVAFVFVPFAALTVACPAATIASETTVGETVPPQVVSTRPENRTYLSLPEWTIVYSAEEYADYVHHASPASFPYFRSIAQQWWTYCRVYSVIRNRYPFNLGDHAAIAVIDTSYSLEYGLKGLYESTVGRVFEWIDGNDTEEDRFDNDLASRYAHFLHAVPFYEYPYLQELKDFWSQTSLWGPHPIRKWERKIFLSVQYAGKGMFGEFIKFLTKTAYAPEPETTKARVTAIREDLNVDPRIHVLQDVTPTAFDIETTRYEPFREVTQILARRGVRFVHVEGNDEMLVTVLAPSTWTYTLPYGQELFRSALPSNDTIHRVAIRAPLPLLSNILVELERQQPKGVSVEHLYDY